MFEERLKKLQKLLLKKNLDALFVTNPYNIFYLTGFMGLSPEERESSALIDKTGITLTVPKMYREEGLALNKNSNLKLEVVEERNYIFTKSFFTFHKSNIVGIEAENLTISEYNLLKENTRVNFRETIGLIESLRLIKDNNEIILIKKAVEITDRTFENIRKHLKEGLSEKLVSRKIIEHMDDFGADGVSFSPIVANGSAQAFPHYQTGKTPIKKGILLIDAGAKFKGYNGDLTRTYHIGKPDNKFIERYKLLLEVQLKILDFVKPGLSEEEVWQKSVKFLGNEAKYFIHGLGHGIGIEVHEAPNLRKGRILKLKPGMTITIEPGIYYPGWGGIRIEDYILVTKDGCEVLSKTPKDLKSIII